MIVVSDTKVITNSLRHVRQRWHSQICPNLSPLISRHICSIEVLLYCCTVFFFFFFFFHWLALASFSVHSLVQSDQGYNEIIHE